MRLMQCSLQTAVAASLLLGAQTVMAAHPAEEAHGHGHDAGHDAAVLELDAGRKWATDESLRQGMRGIRAAVASMAAQSHRLTAAQGRQGAKEIRSQLAYIFQHCRLEPKADAMLHVLLTRLSVATDALAGAPDPAHAVEELTAALHEYPHYFHDPDWQPL